jgi:carbon storage regulator
MSDYSGSRKAGYPAFPTTFPFVDPMVHQEEEAMLVLSRKPGERIVIADNIIVTVVQVQGGTVRLGVEAPLDVRVRRQELAPQPRLRAEVASGGSA